MFPGIAIVFTLLGMAGIYRAWKYSASTPFLLLHLLFLITSLVFWHLAYGPEYGAIYWIAGCGFTALLLTLINGKFRPVVARRAYRVYRQPQPAAVWLHNLCQFVLAVPLAGVAAASISIGLVSLTGFSRVNEMVLGVFAIPVVWGGMSYWACSQPRLTRAVGGLAISFAVGLAGVWL